MTNGKIRGQANVVVIGGGIAGMATANRLAGAGVSVHIVESASDIGGHVREMGCKAGSACVRCNVCVADRLLRETRIMPGVQVHLSSSISAIVAGTQGSRFSARIQPSPVSKPDGLRSYITSSARKLPREISADAVVIATGYTPYSPIENASLGYGRIPNVITGDQAERQIAKDGRLSRPSDGHSPKRIAFIQCVGSRTEEVFRRPEDTDYCSTVCCAYALRMARQLAHQSPEAAITIFYMDIQNFGKNFNAFFADCKARMKFVRSRPFDILPGPDGSANVRYATDPGHIAVQSDSFDLVILSVGIRPASGARPLAERLGLPLDPQGFFGLKQASALPDLQKAGFFVAGAAEGPKDIAGSIAQAEAVSAAVLDYLKA